MDNPRYGLDYGPCVLYGGGLSLLSLALGLRCACIGRHGLHVGFLAVCLGLLRLIGQKVVASGFVAARAVPSTRAKEASKDRDIDQNLRHWSVTRAPLRALLRLGK